MHKAISIKVLFIKAKIEEKLISISGRHSIDDYIFIGYSASTNEDIPNKHKFKTSKWWNTILFT